MSLRYKLLSLFIILAIIPLGFAGNSMIRRTRDEIKTIAQDNLMSTADMIIRDIHNFRDAWMTVIQLIKKSVESQDVSLEGKLTLIKEALGGNQTDIVSIQISVAEVPAPLIITDTKFLARFAQASVPPQTILARSQESIQQDLGESAWFISDPFWLADAKSWVITIIFSLNPDAFAMPATLTALIDLSRFEERIQSYHFGKIGVISLIADAGVILPAAAHSTTGFQGQFDSAIWSKLETEGKVLVETRVSVNDETVLGAYSFTKHPEFRIAVEMVQSKAYESVRQMELFYYKWIAFGLAIAVIGALIVSEFLTRPLRRLTDAAREIASGNFNVVIEGQRHNDEIGELSVAFLRMQTDLKQHIEQLKETTKAKERVESELELAKEIQQNFLPKTFPQSPAFDIWGRCFPAREVGGDYFDCFRLDDRHYGFVVGDVTGKGIPAALFMAVSRTLFRMLSIGKYHPDQVLTDFNEHLVALDANANMFITLFYGIIDSQTGLFRYSTAGHNMPFIKCAAQSQTFALPPGLKTMVAGMISGVDMEAAEITLNPGDVIVLYTDGMTEAINDQGEEFGEAQLADLLTQYADLSAQEMCDRVIQHVMHFQGDNPQFDDMTLFVLKMKDSGSLPAASAPEPADPA